jgi:minimal PKS chain-length factor (CLF/KS beta)
MSREAVITGIGVVSPAGIGCEAFWQGVSSGQSFISPLTRFDATRFASKMAGVVQDFNAAEYIDPRIIAQTDRWTHFDLTCAREAFSQAGLDVSQEEPTRVGSVFAAGTGGNAFGQQQLHLCWEKSPRYVSAYESIAWFYAASIGQVSIRHGIRGYGRNICAEAAGGLIALTHAARIIAQGLCDVVVAGGSEASIAPYAFACHQASGLISTETAAYPYRPFDASRSGPIVGEGGAVFCIESKEHARQRGATILGEIVGGGQTFDGQSAREPAQDGKEYARAIRQALTNSGLQPTEIDWIICDGLGTQQGDLAEYRALRQVFATDLEDIPASAPKSMFGRLFNGGSPVDVIMALLGMRHETVLPTVGSQQQDPRCPLDIVANKARSQTLRHVLIGARGFGGFNSALIVRNGSLV